jgi:pyruvate/2-oxoglutarate dehydrogenase complex dihydrolipoamide acyltransferase (E2) component
VYDGPPASPVGRGGRVPSSPAAKKRAADLGIDLAQVAATGPGGRVTIDDVNLAAKGEAGLPPETGSSASEALVSAAARRLVGVPGATSATMPWAVTHHVRADACALVELIATFNVNREGRDDISVTAALVKAVAATLRERPRLAAIVSGGVGGEGSGIDVGVDVAGPDGVAAVIVRDAAAKTLGEVSREFAALASRAHEHAPVPQQVPGGFFTVADMSDHGAVDWSTPVLNRGEAAILAVGRIVDDVVAIDGSPTVRPTVGLSLTFDQRVIDQASAVDFLAVLLDHLAHPARMLV